jgi:hypothetical protein
MNRKYLILRVVMDESRNISYTKEHECETYKEALHHLKDKPDRESYIIQDIFF